MLNRFFALLLWLGIPNGQSALATPLPVDARCSVSLGSGVVDYGTLSRWQLQGSVAGSHALTLGKRTLLLSVVCPYTQTFRLTLRGERAASGDLRYGERGSLSIRLSDVQLDGQNVQVVDSSPRGVINGTANVARQLQPGQTFAPSMNGRLAEGKALTARIEIEPLMPEAEARVGALQISEARFKLELMD